LSTDKVDPTLPRYGTDLIATRLRVSTVELLPRGGTDCMRDAELNASVTKSKTRL
jgi:hypothetical protein